MGKRTVTTVGLTAAEKSAMIEEALRSCKLLEGIRELAYKFISIPYPLPVRQHLTDGVCEIITELASVLKILGVRETLPSVDSLQKHSGWVSENSLKLVLQHVGEIIDDNIAKVLKAVQRFSMLY
jgi:hypothetical protein